MREDQVEKLRGLGEATTDDLIEIVQAANDTEFDTEEGRGNKVWLYKAANQCAAVLSKIEQIIAIREGKLPPISACEETNRKHEENIIKKAEAEAEKRKAQFH